MEKRPVMGMIHHLAKGFSDAEPAVSKVTKIIGAAAGLSAAAIIVATASIILPLPLAAIAYTCASITIGAGVAAAVILPGWIASNVGGAAAANVADQTQRYEGDVSLAVTTSTRRVGAGLMAAFVLGTGGGAVYKMYDVLATNYARTVKMQSGGYSYSGSKEENGTITAKFNPSTGNGGPSITLASQVHAVPAIKL